METIDLIKILHGDIHLIDRVNIKDKAQFERRMEIYPEDVRKMLIAFLEGRLTDNDLNKWAKFICLRIEYCHPKLKRCDLYLMPQLPKETQKYQRSYIYVTSEPDQKFYWVFMDGTVKEAISAKRVKEELKELLGPYISKQKERKNLEQRLQLTRERYPYLLDFIIVYSDIEDEKANYYEDMWYVIQKLSTPEIDGEINEERIKQYLAELDKYKNPLDTKERFFSSSRLETQEENLFDSNSR